MKEGWTYRKLGEVCDILDSQRKPITKGKRESGSIPYYGATGCLDYVKDYIFDEKLVLLGEDGAKWGAGENSAYIIEGKSWVNNHAHTLRPKRELLVDELLVYYLNFSNLLIYITGVTVPKLNQEKMRSIEIPIGPVKEQQSIVDYLDSAFAKIDAMKANAEKALNEAKALFQASLKEMLEPKEGWEEKKLQEVAYDFSRGKSKHRPRNDKKLFGGKYPFIQTGEIRNANVYVTSHSSTYNEIGLSQSKLWPKDTVCITIAANIAEVAILKYPSCFPDSVIGFVADRNKVDKLFVFYSLLKYQQDLKKQGKGSAQDNINLGTFEKNYFPFPSLEEQQNIVCTLDSLKSKVDKLQENYDKISQECDALKQAILRQVFE